MLKRSALLSVGVAVIFSACSRTLQLSLPSDTMVQVVTSHEGADGITRPHEVSLPPDSLECQRLRQWVAQNQRGWSQSLATNPSGGIVVHAGKLSLQFVDSAVFVWTDRGQFQKKIREEDYAFLKKRAGI